MLSHLRSSERYDEPETLPSSIRLICLTGADGGHDTYVFTGAYGNDIVTDFQPGNGIHDVLQLDASVWAGYGDVIAHTTDDGAGNTTIAFGGNSILLLHVSKSQFAEDDFQFV